MRKSRNSQITLMGAMTGLLLFPQMLWAYSYQYMKDNRERINRSAASVYVSEDRKTPQPYEEVGPLKKTAQTRGACIKRLRRQAWRKKIDGVIQIKYSAQTLSNQISCEGMMVRWKTGETQASETHPTETSRTP